MNKSKLMILVLVLLAVHVMRSEIIQEEPKKVCESQDNGASKKCALRPRTRRQCPKPEYGLNCDSCCYQSYKTPSYYGYAFRPYYGDGYFGRRQGNYNFTF